MIDFELKIFLGLYDKAVENAMKETALPAGIHAEFIFFHRKTLQVPDNVTAVYYRQDVSASFRQYVLPEEKSSYCLLRLYFRC